MAKFRKTDKEKFQNSSNAVGIAETREPRSGEDFHKMWLSRIDTAIRTRELHQDGINVWNRMYNLYKGDHWPTEDDEPIFLNSDEPRVKITVNKCKSVVKNTLAFILQSNPKFIANPKRAEDVNSAKIQAEWLNVLWDELDINSIIEDVLRDWLIIGMGVAKTGFRYQKDSRVMSVKLDGTINYSDYMIDEQPFVYRVNPKMFLWDFNEQFDNSRWCCEILFKTKTDVYANKNYSQKALNMIRTGMQSPISVASFTQSTRENYKALGIEESHTDDEERLVIYEIWDKKYRQHLVYLAGVTEPLIDEVWPYDYLLDDNEGFPYEVIFFDPIPNEPFAQGIIKAFEDQQYEKNRNRTAGFGHRRRFNRKYAVVEDSVSPQDIDMLANGGDGAIIKVKSAGDIQPIQDAPLSSDHYNQEQIIDNDIAELTGADALFTGGRLPSRTSAQEINARGNVQSTKLSLPINRADKFCVNIGYKTLSHSRANVTGVQAIRILGSLANTWEQFQTSTLSSRITLKLEYSTSKPYNSDMDKQQRMGVFQMLTNVFQLLQQTQVQVNFGELLKWTLEPFDIKDVARFLPGNAMINPVPPWQVIPINNGQNGQQPMNPQNMPMGLPSTPNPMASQMGQQGASGNAQSQNMGSLLGGG